MSISSKYPSIRPTKVINLSKETLLNSSVEYSRGGAGTYIDENGLIVSAAPDQPRFSHNAETLEYEGLLVEEARSNLINVGNTPVMRQNYGKISRTIVNNILTPFGDYSDVAVFTRTSGSTPGPETIGPIGDISLTAGTTYTFSVFYKPISGDFLGAFSDSIFIAQAFSPYSEIPLSITSSRSISYPNGWIRYYGSGTITSTQSYVTAIRLGAYSSINDPTGKVGISAAFWGLQIEAGAFPTSYIPTTASAVARPADLVSVSSVSGVKSGRIKFSSVASNSYSPYFTLKDSVLPAKPYVLELGSVNSAPVASVVYNSVRQGTTSFVSVPGAGVPSESTLSFNFEPTTGAVEISSTSSDDADSHVLSLPANLSRPLPSDQTLDLFSVEGKSIPLSLKEIYLWETALNTDQLASVSGELKSIGQPVEASTGINENSDYADAGSRPTLDLRFAERKDLFDDTTEQNLVTFSRGSTATYTDEEGIIQTAVADESRFDHDPATGESLGLLVEEARTNKAWLATQVYPNLPTIATPNAAVAPDGTFTAWSISSYGFVSNQFPMTYPNYWSLSFFAKPGSGVVDVAIQVDALIQIPVYFNFITKTFTASGFSYEEYPNGWYKIKFTKNQTSYIGGHVLRSGFRDGSGNISSGYLWGLQVELGSFPTSYIPTPATFTSRASTATYYDATGTIQTAQVNEARDNAYLPDENGVFHPAGLLLEAAGTNVLYFDTALTTKLATTSEVGPHGSSSNVYNRLASGFDTGAYVTAQSGWVQDNGMVLSIFVKKTGTGRYFRIGSLGQGQLFGNTPWTYDYDNKALVEGSNVALDFKVEVLSNGWHRISARSADIVRTSAHKMAVSVHSSLPTSSGNLDTGLIYGIQLEEGKLLTSYIPTTSSTVTRAADVSSSSTATRSADAASISGANLSSWYNYDSSTVFIEGRRIGGSPRLIELAGIAGENRIWANNDWYTSSYQTGGTANNLQGVTIPVGVSLKYAYGFEYNGTDTIKSAVRSGLTNVITSTTLGARSIPDPTAGGVSLNFAGQGINSKIISRFTYWPTRLPNTTLQVLTDPAISTWDLVFDSSLSTDGTCAVITASTCTYTIDWGDGTPVQTVNATGTGFEATHRYTFPQTYKVKIDVLSGAFMPYYNGSVYARQLVEIRQTPDGWTNTATSGFGTNLQSAWLGANNLKVVDRELNTSGVTNLASTWSGCSSLTNFPLIDTSDCTSFSASWNNCTNLATFPLLNTSSGTSFGSTWANCTSLTSFPLIDTSSGTLLSTAWQNCTSLTSFPQINTSSATELAYSWANCTSLTSFPFIDVNNCIYFAGAWRICTSLTDFPANLFNSWSATPYSGCFAGTWLGCSSLTPTSVENILNSISISPSSSTPPLTGTDITIDYNATITPGPDITVPAIDLLAKGWTPKLNGVTPDPYALASLDLDFATNLSLTDNISGNNLITFSRGSVGTYVDSAGVIQTAAAGAPRFDHDPVTLESLGLLVEEQRINIALNSENISAWAKNGNGIGTTADQVIAPDNQLTADIIFQTSTTGAARWMGSNSLTVTSGVVYTFSCWVKKVSGTDTQPSITMGFINLGQYGSSITPNITSEWKRFTTTLTANSTAGTWLGFNIGWDGNGAPNNNVYAVWGFQVEVGSFPTSYIPTSGGQGTRNADEVSITGTDFSSWYNQSESTVFTDVKILESTPGFDKDYGVWFGRGSNGITGIRHDYTQPPSSAAYIFNDSGIAIAVGVVGPAPTTRKAASAIRSDSTSYCLNGTLSSTSVPVNMPTTVDRLLLGGYNNVNGRNKTIARLTYWPKRLTDTSLQYLTT